MTFRFQVLTITLTDWSRRSPWRTVVFMLVKTQGVSSRCSFRLCQPSCPS